MTKPTVRVLFRIEGPSDPDNVTAVFDDADIAPNRTNDFVLYAHIGQHGEGRMAWYRTTRAATPKEYSALLRELRKVYADCKLIVGKHRTVRHSRDI